VRFFRLLEWWCSISHSTLPAVRFRRGLRGNLLRVFDGLRLIQRSIGWCIFYGNWAGHFAAKLVPEWRRIGARRSKAAAEQ